MFLEMKSVSSRRTDRRPRLVGVGSHTGAAHSAVLRRRTSSRPRRRVSPIRSASDVLMSLESSIPAITLIDRRRIPVSSDTVPSRCRSSSHSARTAIALSQAWRATSFSMSRVKAA